MTRPLPRTESLQYQFPCGLTQISQNSSAIGGLGAECDRREDVPRPSWPYSKQIWAPRPSFRFCHLARISTLVPPFRPSGSPLVTCRSPLSLPPRTSEIGLRTSLVSLVTAISITSYLFINIMESDLYVHCFHTYNGVTCFGHSFSTCFQ